ncbi:SGNH hydrolase domain-containing protein [Brachybacterium sp. DNPG3]
MSSPSDPSTPPSGDRRRRRMTPAEQERRRRLELVRQESEARREERRRELERREEQRRERERQRLAEDRARREAEQARREKERARRAELAADWLQASAPEPAAHDELGDWTQEPASTLRISTPSVAPVAASALEDWLQGPIEKRVELNAEDAWSTADSVTSRRRRRADDASGDSSGGSGTTAEQRSRPVFRTELHGLRAVALGLVAVYHIWLGRVSGGVDVFLFLSAFFLTGTFVRRLESGRALQIPRYWLHVFKRLLPPAAVTILLTLLATGLLLPSSLWPAIMQQAVASAMYLQNALLVLLQVDYQARDSATLSPLQHFWSLSVQGQAFVVWPLLFALMIGRARRGRGVRAPLFALMSVIAAASLAWSIHSTITQQQIAYFDTAARLWEFAAGSLLALALPAIDRITRARRPEDDESPSLRVPRALLGWAGIAALLACGIVLDVSGEFPGWIAIWPLTAAGAIVVAGHSGTAWGVDRLLSTRPAAFVGDISYALYLVHWPILAMWLHVSEQSRAGILDGLVVLSGSVLLAWLVTRLVDAPVRRSAWLEARPWRSLTAIAASFALVAAAAGGWWTVLQRTADDGSGTAVAAEIPTDEVATEAPAVILPYGWQLGDQWPDLPERCAGPWAPSTTFPHVTCQQLLEEDAEATGVVVVVGSSHARQYIPAITPWAEARGLQIVNLSMDGCDFLPGTDRDAYCNGYDEYVLAQLDVIQPDYVLTTVTSTTATAAGESGDSGDSDGSGDSGDSAGEVTREGSVQAVEELVSRGIGVIAARDTPRWEEDMYQCPEAVIAGGGTPLDADAACGADASDKLAADSPAADLVDLATDEAPVMLLDLSEQICPDGRCSPILGDTYVYLDANHLTRRFVEQTLAPAATPLLEEAFPG